MSLLDKKDRNLLIFFAVLGTSLMILGILSIFEVTYTEYIVEGLVIAVGALFVALILSVVIDNYRYMKRYSSDNV